MRRFWAVTATLSLAGSTVSTVAWAKTAKKAAKDVKVDAPADDGADSSSGDDATENAPKAIVRPPPNAAAGQDGQIQVAGQAGNDTHTVVRGDTLWDLSQKYLGNPWYWPKVWSYNPQINNPHWIYPGDQVKFQGGIEEAPAEVQNAPEGEEELPGDDDMVRATGKIGYVPPRVASFRKDGFVTDRELEESGQIVKSFAEVEMLSNLDKAYMRFKSTGDVKIGDRYFIYNTVREIKHPITGQKYGYLTHIVGTVKVIAIADNQVVSGLVDSTWDEIYRGYYLAPFSEKVTSAVPTKQADKLIKGNIIESMTEVQGLGEDEVVFVDKGSKDGLEAGNTMDVLRRADGATQSMLLPGQDGYEDKTLPWETVGRLIVVDVKENAATCLVLRSVREFVPGDVVVTTPPGNPKVSMR